jgi:hypothetical protein
MKRNDVGNFTVLYVEPGDQRADLFQTVAIQEKPVVIILASQTGILQKPDDFTLLKYVKRQTDLPIIFILSHGSQQAQLAARNGFPVYQSMDALLDALSVGHMRIAHSLALSRSTKPLFPAEDSQREQQAVNGRAQAPLPKVEASPLCTQDEQSQQEPGSRHLSQPLTPIPQSLIPAEDIEQQEPYPDPHRVVPPNAKDNARHNHDTAWPDAHIDVSDRNTGPLTPRKAASSPAPQTPSIEQASERGFVGAGQKAAGAELAPQSSASPADKLGMTSIGTGKSQAPIREWVAQADQRSNNVPPTRTGARPVPTQPFHNSVGLGRGSRDRALHRSRLYILLCVLVIGSIGAFLVLPHFLNGVASTPQIDGHMVFTSSGQVSETSSQGIEDQVTLDLTNIALPTTGKALYAWLLGDQSQNDPRAILLGKLQLNNGTVHVFYPGNAQHTNLLLTMSRVLVTEEDTTFAPVAPSPDQNTWRYYSELSTTPINAPGNTKNFSFLDHLRHLLASDPTLEELELHGGLNNWLYNNTNKVKEWIDSTRQQWEETKDTNFVRRQLERSLQFLDGDTFVYQDVPQGTALLVNERLARIGLVNVTGPNQEPPDYLNHISHHLNGLLEAKPTPAVRQKIAALITALGNVNQWLEQVRHDAHQLLQMTDDQMMQSSTLSVINDMIANMDQAHSGLPDPSTNTVHEGVNWIHNQMQFLATLDITRWHGTNPSPTSTKNVPNPNNPNLSQPRVLIAEEDKSSQT